MSVLVTCWFQLLIRPLVLWSGGPENHTLEHGHGCWQSTAPQHQLGAPEAPVTWRVYIRMLGSSISALTFKLCGNFLTSQSAACMFVVLLCFLCVFTLGSCLHLQLNIFVSLSLFSFPPLQEPLWAYRPQTPTPTLPASRYLTCPSGAALSSLLNRILCLVTSGKERVPRISGANWKQTETIMTIITRGTAMEQTIQTMVSGPKLEGALRDLWHWSVYQWQNDWTALETVNASGTPRTGSLTNCCWLQSI